MKQAQKFAFDWPTFFVFSLARLSKLSLRWVYPGWQEERLWLKSEIKFSLKLKEGIVFYQDLNTEQNKPD